LAVNNIVTEYQLGVIGRGRGEQLRLDQYVLLDRIGKGRMAGVYKAVHAIGTPVAIKILPPSKAKEPETLARFRREARLTAKLRHPNVVRSFQAGTYNGLHFLVMEYLEGETLKEVLERRRKLPPGEAARLVHQALLGLQHIFEKGMIHRDLEPANLMLLGGKPESTLTATVKILDIGLGRALFDEDAASPGAEGHLVTAPGTILGTPDYMAPEQARDSHAADVRSDIYSLGCVLYHCLTGQPPFADSNRVRVMVKHATEKARPLKELNPSVPDGLQQILDWMMAKDPAQRYPTPERAAKALEMFLAAGSEVVALERDPRMRPYLDWLDNHVTLYEDPEEPPLAKPVPATPPALPAAAAAPKAPAVPVADVELVAAPAPVRKRDPEEPVLLGLSMRDFLMLAIGVAVVGVVLAVMGVLYLVGRSKNRDNDG
jgi:serine/threonine protein kinase